MVNKKVHVHINYIFGNKSTVIVLLKKNYIHYMNIYIDKILSASLCIL